MKHAFVKFALTLLIILIASFDWGKSISAQTTPVQSNEKAAEFPDDGLDNSAFIFGSTGNDPSLPRYLCIGDSISSNYGKAIVDIHAGKMNSHHPPTNCGSSANGRERIVEWLGDYETPGQQWDVISFNFGHWDASRSQDEYQSNLRAIIGELKKTKAKLVWVTTCPVPMGFEPAGDLDSEGRAPGRKSGVMLKYLNPWADEVMANYPEITICDQWQFVDENREGRYKNWWQGRNVHFSEGPAYAIGRLLAHHVLEVEGLYRTPGFKRPTTVLEPPDPPTGPGWVPFDYATAKFGQFYSGDATKNALPDRWQNATRLASGFPKDFPIDVVAGIPDGHGWTYELDKIANHLQLKAIKKLMQQGFGLAGNRPQSDEEVQAGPGKTGTYFLVDIVEIQHAKGAAEKSFAPGLISQNVSLFYDLYRITRDRYYADEIVKYATAVDWIIANRPGSFGRTNSEPLVDETAYSLEFGLVEKYWAQANAARLLLEQVRVDRAPAKDPRVVQAKRFLLKAIEGVDPHVNGAYQHGQNSADTSEEVSVPFEPGRNTLWLVEQRKVPERAAQVIEYTRWMRTLRYLALLTALTRAMEELEGIENNNENSPLITSYRRTVAAGIELFQRENDCVVKDGKPYFFHSTSPLRDKTQTTRMGHPMFRGEQMQNVGANAWNLVYIWEANESFGCSAALLAAYSNAVVDQLNFPTGTKIKQLYPRSCVDSAWYVAATGVAGADAKQLGGRLLAFTPFAPDMLVAHHRWKPRREYDEDIQLLKAAALYREWQRRQQRNAK